MEGAKVILRYSVFWVLPLFLSCDSPFSYSLYQANVPPEHRNLTHENLLRIREMDTLNRDAFRIAVLADTHYHYDELTDAIRSINENEQILFAVLVGDLTDLGLLDEFLLLREVMRSLDKPYLTVIGNHDYLSNGETIYGQMFGDFNYSLVFNNTRLILFDDVFWESNRTPDFDWLAAELAQRGSGQLAIPFAHIQPADDQFADEHKMLYHGLMKEHGITMSVHGHDHNFTLAETFGDGVSYVTVSSPQKSSYTELTIAGNSVTARKIEF